MSEDKTANLIGELVEEHCAVECTRHPLRCSSMALVVSTLYVATVVYFMGVRSDVVEAFQSPVFLYELTTMGLVAITAALASAWLRVPDMRGSSWIVAVPVTLFASFMLWSFIRILDEGYVRIEYDWYHCIQDSLILAAIPIICLVTIGRQGNTVRPVLMSFMNILSVAAMGYIGLRLTCAADSLEHIGPYHILPYVLIGVIMGLLARRLIYKW